MVFKSLITAGTVGAIAKTSLSAIKSLPGINLAASALNAVMAATVVEMLGQMTILLFENIKSGKISLDKYNEVENFIKDYVKDNVPAIVETIEKMVSKNGDKINPKDVVKKLSKH